MKAIVVGITAAILLACVTALVLDRGVQQDAAERYATTGVRL